MDSDDHSRTILHFDVDCFYAQVEMLRDPSLSDKPLGIQQKNIVVTCNYVARDRGVKKCSFIAEAKKACPDLVLVNGEDLSRYRKMSQDIFDCIRDYCGGRCPVEKLGLDENFVDVSLLVQDWSEEVPCVVKGNTFMREPSVGCDCNCHSRLKIGSVIAWQIRDKLLADHGITCSSGIAHNKLLAKLAGNLNKPNDQTAVFPETSSDLMLSLPGLKSIPGLGSATCQILQSKGVTSVEQLQELSSSSSSILFDTETHQKLQLLSRGIDPSPVKLTGKPLSIGLEDRFRCISSKSECEEKVKWLLQRLALLLFDDGRQPQTIKVTSRDLVKDNASGKSFGKASRQCRIRSSLFSCLKTATTGVLSDSSLSSLTQTVMELMSKMVDFQQPFHLTLVGVAVSDFVSVSKGLDAFLRAEQLNSSVKRPHSTSSSDEPIMAKKARQETSTLPTGWDPDVFNSLPPSLQKELLSSQDPPGEIRPSASKKPKQSSNSIVSIWVGLTHNS